MSDKIRLVVDEEPEIVERIDALARQEGLSRSDMLRRAIRRLLAAVPTQAPLIEQSPFSEAVGK